jgi:hypothetical protein
MCVVQYRYKWRAVGVIMNLRVSWNVKFLICWASIDFPPRTLHHRSTWLLTYHLQSVQSGFSSYTASCPVDIGASGLRVRWPVCETDTSCLVPRLKNALNRAFPRSFDFVACCLMQHRDNCFATVVSVTQTTHLHDQQIAVLVLATVASSDRRLSCFAFAVFIGLTSDFWILSWEWKHENPPERKTYCMRIVQGENGHTRLLLRSPPPPPTYHRNYFSTPYLPQLPGYSCHSYSVVFLLPTNHWL